jgi:two-component system nitrogen regulation sensor histidine kinase GlnL
MPPGVSAPQPDPLATGQPGFAELFASLPVAVLVIDARGCVAHANGAAEQLINLSERAMRGQPVDSILVLPQDYRLRPVERDFAAFDTAIDLVRGGRVRVDFIEALVPDRPGWRTMTLHNAANSRRAGSTDRAAARAAIGAAAMLAHEIKNPLSGIRGAAQLLQGNGAEADDLTNLITTEVDRIAALIDRMQDFTDTRPLALAPHNIYPLLDHARKVALAGFARGVLIEERFDPSLPAVIVDRDAMLQVILNLLKNAAEATAQQADARIMLTTAYRHGMAVSAGPGKPRRPLPIELCVIDNGPGVPPDIADHLFDPFVSGKPEGQGLGLALVDKLVRDMGGIIEHERDDAPAQTVFRLLLPRAEAER